MRLATHTTTDLGSLAPTILVIPVGSCEQHGPHLPLGTDTIIAEALAGRLVRQLPEAVVGPSLTVTASGEHAGFPGTLSIGVEVTTAVIVELVRSADWAAGTVLVNGHGGNAEPVARAVALLRSEGRNVVAWWPPPLPAPHDAHAGHTETSLMLALAPDLVRRDRLEPGETRPLAELASSLRAGGLGAVTRNGVLGDPRAATLEAGITLLDLLTDDLVTTATKTATAEWHLELQSRPVIPPDPIP